MDYTEKINKISTEISKNIFDLSIERKRGTAPTQAFSDFLTHSEQGDWAEILFFNSVKKSKLPFVPVRYGKADKIIAGDPDFKEFYNSYQDELDTIGKRPDVLFFNPKDYKEEWGDNISQIELKSLDKIVKKSIGGFEVRSSAYLTQKFTPKDGRPFLSFTPKVEDLLVVLKWINTFNVPHFYVQVFFDSIYIISFMEILLLLKNAEIEERGIKNKKILGKINGELAFAIEKNPKNQYKETIHIFLNNGHVISNNLKKPKLIGNRKELASGRLLHYVTFDGGEAELDEKLLDKIIREFS